MIKNFFEKIIIAFDDILAKFGSVVAPGGDFKIYRYVVAGILFLGFSLLFIFIRKNNIIKKTYRSSYEKLLLLKLESEKDIKKIKAKNINPITTAFNNKFIYSRLDKYIKFMTPELWLGFLFIVFGVVLIVLLAFRVNILTALLISFLAAFIPYLIEMLMAHSNYKKVDKQLIEFLNMLGNYSGQNTEITDILSHVYTKMEEPLASAIKECVYESESIGIEQAMTNLSNKIEHPKFKEIIQNLRVAQKYSASFKVVVENNNTALVDYIRQKKERDHLATFNTITLMICIVIAIAIFYVLGEMINQDVFAYLIGTPSGQIAVAIALGCIGFFAWKIYTIDK